MKKMILTGVSGFLGSRIYDYYKTQYEIYGPSHEEMDISVEESVMEYFQRIRPDYVVHCAAVSDTGKCEREPELSHRMNVEGYLNIVKASKNIDAKCVLCSSDQVYFGKNEGRPHKEDEILIPANVYGRDKLKAENMALAIDPESVHLRLAWLYDSRKRNDRKHSDFIRTFLWNIKEGNPMSYPIYDVRGITDVWEVVKNIEAVFRLPGGAYNFGSPNDKTTYETVKTVFETLNLDAALLFKNEEAFAEKPRNLSMDQEKINNYGIFFSTTLEGILRNCTKELCILKPECRKDKQ